MTDLIALLPCPFCGSPAVKSSFDRETFGMTQIQCGNDETCKVCVDVQHFDEAIAVKAWNTRAPLLSIVGQMKRD